MRRRWILLALLLPLYTILVGQIGWILCVMIATSGVEVFEHWDAVLYPLIEPAGRVWVFGPAALLTITQVLFLLPVVRPVRMAPNRGRSLVISIVASGFCGAMLTAGLLFALVEGYGLLIGKIDPIGDWIESYDFLQFGGWWSLVGASWLLWTPLLIVFARRKAGPRLLARMVAMLFAGTILEVLVVVPLDIMVRRRTNCYCGTGTAWALCLSTCALLWLTGPGIVLAVTSKRRRWWLEDHCAQCGYEKGPSPGERCPECGFEWMEKT